MALGILQDRETTRTVGLAGQAADVPGTVERSRSGVRGIAGRFEGAVENGNEEPWELERGRDSGLGMMLRPWRLLGRKGSNEHTQGIWLVRL